MFTGLIEKTAKIEEYSQNQNGAIITINCSFFDDTKIGDSISINGVCLTVIKIAQSFMSFEISKETLDIVNVDGFKKGKVVNLERALKADSRLDGHMVSGHIDGIGVVKKIVQDGFSYKYEFETTDNILKYIVKKGSVAVNGISLTVTIVEGTTFSVEIIPHTLKETNLANLKIGDYVNIETDIFARYVEKFLSLNNNNSKISMEMLKENGYL